MEEGAEKVKTKKLNKNLRKFSAKFLRIRKEHGKMTKLARLAVRAAA